MNSEQLRLFIKGASAEAAETEAIMKRLRPWLADALIKIRAEIEKLPDASLTRQRDWRALLPYIENLLGPYNDQFFAALETELPAGGLKAAGYEIESVRSLGVPVAGSMTPEKVMAESTKFLLRTQVDNKRIAAMFDRRDGSSVFTKYNRNQIDQIVTGGIIEGKPTNEIADEVIGVVKKTTNASRYGGAKGVKRLTRLARNIAGTAILDYNRQVREQVFNDNAEAMKEGGVQWEWVAILDSRTCPICIQYDNEVRKENTFPAYPIHLGPCRCKVVPIYPDSPRELRGRTALLNSETPTKGKPGGYATKQKTKGENLFRRRTRVNSVDGKRPGYTDWMEELAAKSKGVTAEDLRKSPETHKRDLNEETLTLRQIFGSNKKTAKFIELVNEKGVAADTAFKRVVIGG